MERNYHLKLRSLREATGKTQKQVADELGVSNSAYNSWETGRHELNASQIIMLCDYYGCEPNDILGYRTQDKRFELLNLQEGAVLRLFRSATTSVRKSVVILLRAATK